eukprot:TRINITY_DN10789_c0_g1_i4.p1 TRINITY_DN10789_c0_g1~~TRINITY_DN10789_c0_g1_i4.p1  ORF type:complete len:125 (-),score=8.71 TRINITY_DN10789_c0_g1_i4:28-402(-)
MNLSQVRLYYNCKPPLQRAFVSSDLAVAFAGLSPSPCSAKPVSYNASSVRPNNQADRSQGVLRSYCFEQGVAKAMSYAKAVPWVVIEPEKAWSRRFQPAGWYLLIESRVPYHILELHLHQVTKG